MASVKDALLQSKIMLGSMNQLVNEALVNQMLQFEQGFEQTKNQIAKAAEAQEALNQKIGQGGKKAGMLGNMMKWASSLYSAGTMAFTMTVIPAAKEQALEDLFKAKTGNADLGSAMFEQLKQNALRTGADVSESLNNALTFMSMTQNSDQIAQLNNFADRLSMLSPGNKSSKDATAAIMSAMSGDTSALAKNFNIPDAQMKAFNAEIVASKGNFASFLASMDQLLQKSGMTQQAMDTMMDSPMNKWKSIMGHVNDSFVQMGGGALAAITPILDMLQSAFESGSFQPFIDAISIGLSILAQGFVWIAQLVPPAWEFIKGAISGVGTTIWNLINIFIGLMPILTFVGVLIAGLNAGLIAGRIAGYAYSAVQAMMAARTMITTSAIRMFNMIVKANPLVFLISLIIAVISAFGVLGVVTQGVKQVLSNVFGFIVDLAQGTVNTVVTVINGLIKGINAVAGFFGRVLGVNTKQIAEIEYKADFTNFKDKGQDMIENFSMDKFKDQLLPDKGVGKEYEDLLKQNNAGKTGYDVAYPKAAPAPAMPAMPAMPAAPVPVAPAGGSIDSIGQVNNTVDVASEDLKVMRDLAEVNAISNMITLTPTVQMTTGDINSGADLDTIMSRINRTLEEQFVSSAEGVYL
ncbi:hypothetical protein [Paenibacillus lactis]|uniref:Uncharacterized protein n=1 Tax=Paenibacillus lactis 154 TaxID=743719 RepID=G4HLN9_9BACL|nr:hypothetical protein [Paenibacillus lactis]EHB56965.1 hypothetical protein PaelaDRAFT_4900 [Paenibacillus lactis 154]